MNYEDQFQKLCLPVCDVRTNFRYSVQISIFHLNWETDVYYFSLSFLFSPLCIWSLNILFSNLSSISKFMQN